jgi:hypothetical protein
MIRTIVKYKLRYLITLILALSVVKGTTLTLELTTAEMFVCEGDPVDFPVELQGIIGTLTGTTTFRLFRLNAEDELIEPPVDTKFGTFNAVLRITSQDKAVERYRATATFQIDGILQPELESDEDVQIIIVPAATNTAIGHSRNTP